MVQPAKLKSQAADAIAFSLGHRTTFGFLAIGVGVKIWEQFFELEC